MRPYVPLVLLPVLAALAPGSFCPSAPHAEPRGTIAGVVRYTGKVPETKVIPTTDGSTVKHRDLIVDPRSKGLRDVVAALEDAPPQGKVKKANPVVMDQKDMVFVPRVMAVQHGQVVRFENSDSCNHSVLANSTVEANQFNMFVLQGKPFEHAFEAQKHPVQLGCSLHPWMRAWIYVAPHPWFSLSDDRGRFRIAEVPPRKYTLLLRHADTGLLERRQVTVEAGKTAEVSVEWKTVEP
jgi:plastocyanin